MKVSLSNFVFGILVAAASVNGACNLVDCPKGTTCYATPAQSLECMESIPLNTTWALNTVEVISRSLENFGFGALYHSTGPPYSINLDIQGELSKIPDMIIDGSFATDLDFQEHIQNVIQLTLDAHTRYQKPVCYNTILVQPFAFNVSIDGESSPVSEPAVYIMPSVYAAAWSQKYPDSTVDLNSLNHKKIALINGLEPITEISQWGDSHETRSNNRGIRFNSAIRTYLYRNAVAMSVLPIADLVLTLEGGDVVTLPWLATYGQGFANLTYCAAAKPSAAEEVRVAPQSHRVTPHPNPMSPHHLAHEDSPPQLLLSSLTDDRTDRTVIIEPNTITYVSCFTQEIASEEATTAGVQKVLVMKVASFSPPGDDYLVSWAAFLSDAQTCLSVPDYDLLVVDVMANGGGYVCLGLRLIELLVEEFEKDHTKVQMNYDLPHSALMDQYIAVVNAPDPYPDAKAVEQILNKETQQPFVDGNAWYYPGRNVTQGGVVSYRSNWFSLDCREAEAMPANNWTPTNWMTPDRLIILTDGTCGSTCASFTKIPQEAGKATFVGAGGLWGETMDVSSFAGGFVCQPAYLKYLAELSGSTFPLFFTKQSWQFGWAAWYSSILPTRPTQFTTQEPTFRQDFWGFPHASVSSVTTTDLVSNLYDDVISSTVARLAAAVEPETEAEQCSLGTENMVLIIFVVALAVGFLFASVAYYTLLQKYNSKSYKSLSTKNEPFLSEIDQTRI